MSDAMSAALLAFLASRRGGSDGKSESLVDPYRQNPFVRAGVASLFRIVRGVPAKAVAGSKFAPDEAEEVESTHPLATLLATPFRGMYGSEIWAASLAFKKLEGRAFLALYGADGRAWQRKGWPTAMQPLDPRCVRADEADIDSTGSVLRWTVRVRNGTETKIPAEAMIALRDFDPRDPINASSPLGPVWLGMEADLNVDAYSRSWLANLGAIGTWLQLKGPKPSEEETKALLAAFNDAFGGAGSAGKTFVSGDDLDVKAGPTAQTAKDMEMPRLREWNRDAVKAVLGVTDFEVGRVADYNRANSESARKWLFENTIIPELESFEDAFWGHVAEPVSRASRRDEWMRFDREAVPALQSALSERATTAATLVQAGYDPAQVSERLSLGLDAVEIEEPEPTAPTPDGAPAPQVPAGAEGLNGAQVTALLAVLAAVSAGTLKPEAAVLTISAALPMIPEATARRIVAGVIAEPDAPPPAKSAPTIIVKRAQPKPLPRRIALRIQAQWQRHAERKLGVQWRRFTSKRYAETIRLVRNTTDIGAVDQSTVERVLGEAQAWRDGAKAAAERGLKGLGRPLVDNMADTLGTRIDVGQEVHEAAALRRVGQMIDVGVKLRGTIRDSVTRAIADAGTEGVGVDGLEKILEQRFGGRLPSNAATVARTETGIFASDVRRSLMVSEGIEEHIWSSSLDQHTRETHRAIDGEKRKMGERFSNGLLHPLETGAPAGEVVNCRCVELPWIPEADE